MNLRLIPHSLLLASLACLAACNKSPAPASAAPESAAAPQPGPNLTAQPDVGKVEQIAVNATGIGMTPGAAINEALKTAVMQVNGTSVNAVSANMNSYGKATAQLDLETSSGNDSAKLTSSYQSSRFAESIVTESHGLVSSFKVVSLTPPAKEGGSYSAAIEARISKFKAPADSGKIKIVVAPLRSDKASFDIGGKQVPADAVLGQIRQQVIDMLSQSGRFVVLDRQFDGDIAGELALIGSGQAVNTDLAKMGQALTADLVWVGVVNDLAYHRSARQLQTSDRELISFAGGWSMSQRLINLATRQIQQSNTIEGKLPSIAPTTLGASVNPDELLQGMRAQIAARTAEAILLQAFPIAILERDGSNVVLSQGGSAVQQGARYKVYLQGKEIKDAQTGQSLGNTESTCCEVVITRVTPKLSYGKLENVQVSLDKVVPGALQLREAVTATAPPAPDDKSQARTAPEHVGAVTHEDAKAAPPKSAKVVAKAGDGAAAVEKKGSVADKDW